MFSFIMFNCRKFFAVCMVEDGEMELNLTPKRVRTGRCSDSTRSTTLTSQHWQQQGLLGAHTACLSRIQGPCFVLSGTQADGEASV